MSPVKFKLQSDRKYSEEVTITPEIALYMLEDNKINRHISQEWVKTLSQDIKHDNWEDNGEAIILSKEGWVLDGQHRLWACIEAGKPFKTTLTRGVAKETFHTIDTGKKRSPGDVIVVHSKISGQPIRNARQVAASIIMCLEYQRGVLKNKGRGDSKMTRADIVEFYEKHPGIEDWVQYTKVKKDWATAYSAVLAAMCFLASKKYEMKAREFVHGFITGERLDPDSPILAARTYMGIHKNIYKWQRAALIIMMLNYHIEDKKVTKRLKISQDTEIPVILGTEPRIIKVKTKTKLHPPTAKPKAKAKATGTKSLPSPNRAH